MEPSISLCIGFILKDAYPRFIKINLPVDCFHTLTFQIKIPGLTELKVIFFASKLSGSGVT